MLRYADGPNNPYRVANTWFALRGSALRMLTFSRNHRLLSETFDDGFKRG